MSQPTSIEFIPMIGKTKGDSRHYDHKAGYLCTACRFRNTVVPKVCRRPTFWLFLVFHLLVRAFHMKGYLDDAQEEDSVLLLSWNDMKIIAAMTTFFEVFYTNESFSRYLRLHDITRDMIGNTWDFCMDLKLHVGRTSMNHVRLATRYMLASLFLYQREMEDEACQDLRELISLGLLKKEEARFLKEQPIPKSQVMLHWSAALTCEAHAIAQAAPVKPCPANVRKSLVQRVHDVRHGQQQVLDIMNLPVPFPYFHLLNLMIVVNLFLWAYGMGVANSLLGTGVYFFCALIFMGMMELAADLSDPFGQDEVDFPFIEWVLEGLNTCILITELELPGWQDDWATQLATEQPLKFVSSELELETPRASHSISLFAGMAAPDGHSRPERENGLGGHDRTDEPLLPEQPDAREIPPHGCCGDRWPFRSRERDRETSPPPQRPGHMHL